jgi:hypothetical protein
MSIAEMKLAAITEISQLNDEQELKEHLSRLSLEKKEQELNLFQHYDKVKEQYHDVLAKLA